VGGMQTCQVDTPLAIIYFLQDNPYENIELAYGLDSLLLLRMRDMTMKVFS
jgi:hypothetical protein